MSKYDLNFFQRATAEDGSVILSDEVIDFIETRAVGDEVPACRVCGGELSIASMGGGDATVYACLDAPRPTLESTREDRDAFDQHYAESRWKRIHSGDAFVLALVQDYRRLLASK